MPQKLLSSITMDGYHSSRQAEGSPVTPPSPNHPIAWLDHAGQRLGLVPSLGGSVAAWQLDRPQGLFDLWRPWDGKTPDLYRLASFAMVPWSNRISGGGFSATNGRCAYLAPPARAAQRIALNIVSMPRFASSSARSFSGWPE